MSDLKALYAARLAAGEVEPDNAQRAIVERLAALTERLGTRQLARKSSHLGWLFGSFERREERCARSFPGAATRRKPAAKSRAEESHGGRNPEELG